MITKKLILGTAVAALMSGSAFAQDTAPNTNQDATTPPAVTITPDSNTLDSNNDGAGTQNLDQKPLNDTAEGPADAPETTGSTNAMDGTDPAGNAAATGTTVAGGPVNFVSTLSAGQIEVSELTGKQVMNSAGEDLGDISDIIVDQQGNATVAVIGVGGFLGLGEKDVGIPFSSLEMVSQEDGEIALRLNVSKDELANAPTYEGSSRQAAAPDTVAPNITTEPATDAPAATDAEPMDAEPAAPNAQ